MKIWIFIRSSTSIFRICFYYPIISLRKITVHTNSFACNNSSKITIGFYKFPNFRDKFIVKIFTILNLEFISYSYLFSCYFF